MQVCPLCPLYDIESENIEHLFFECYVASYVSRRVLHWQGIHRQAMNWAGEIQWYETMCKGKGNAAIIFRMTLAASVYELWLERNHRVFQNIRLCGDIIVRKIIQEVYVRASMHGKLARCLNQLNYYPV